MKKQNSFERKFEQVIERGFSSNSSNNFTTSTSHVRIRQSMRETTNTSIVLSNTGNQFRSCLNFSEMLQGPNRTQFPEVTSPTLKNSNTNLQLNKSTNLNAKMLPVDATSSLLNSLTLKGRETSSTPVEKKKLKTARYYIFNCDKFEKNDKIKEQPSSRPESLEDITLLENTFKNLQCKGEVYKNKTLKQTKKLMADISNRDFSRRSCVIVVIMSHGATHDRIYAHDSKLFHLHDDIIQSLIKNKTLNDRLKLIFVQACKGKEDLRYLDNLSTDSFNQPHKDIICLESTYEGYVALRSPFIKILCKVLDAKGKTEDIKTICKKIQETVKNETPQCPNLSTTFTDDYCFGDYMV